MTDLLSASELAGLGEVLARAEAEGRAVTFVYAPTTIHHAAPAPAPAPSVVVQPVTVPIAWPAPARSEQPQPPLGIDVDLTGYGGGGALVLPADVAPLPGVPTAHSWAPVVLLISGWGGLGAVFAAVLTSSPFAIGCVALALVVSATAFSEVYRKNL